MTKSKRFSFHSNLPSFIPDSTANLLWSPSNSRLDHTLRGGCELEILADIAWNMFVPALLTAVGHFGIRLLPLVSDRVNTRAVRLAKAKNKQSK